MRRQLFLAAASALFWALPLAAGERSPHAAAWPATDFPKSAIDLTEVMAGGPSRDGIPALSDPKFISAAQEKQLADREPVLTVVLPDQPARACPIRYLMWHGIVNDRNGRNPYVGYDTSQPFLYEGEIPPHGIDPVERVVRVGTRAWPLNRLAAAGEICEAGMILTWTEGQASALDRQTIGAGREVGNIRVRNAKGEDIVHDIPFAFAFHAFHPDGTWMLRN